MEGPFHVTSPPFLTADDVQSIVGMGDVVEALRDAFTTRADDPPRSIVNLAASATPDRVFLSMPTQLDGVAGCKLITLFPDNTDRGLPAIQGIYVLFSAVDGRVRALVDGGVLTKLRTPAASALATDYLTSGDASTLGIFGTGVQAEAHLAAMLAVRPSLRTVVVVSGSQERAEAFARRMTGEHRVAVRSGTPAEAAACEIVCTCTTGSRSLFSAADVAPGAHINAIGAFKPHHLEFGPDVVAGAAVYVDEIEAAKQEAGDPIQAVASNSWTWDQVGGDLVDLVNGTAVAPTDAGWSLFKSVGLSVEDLVVAKLAADRAGLVP